MNVAHTRSFTRFQKWFALMLLVALPIWYLASTAEKTAQNEDGLILLNAGAVDVSRQAARFTLSGERRLRLVQFAGVIKPEWHKALLASGAEVVNYTSRTMLT